MIKLFELDNGKIIPTEHCYTINFLKDIMEHYPDKYLKIYTYLFYMTYPYPDHNPYFNHEHEEREENIMRDIEADFDPDEKYIAKAQIGLRRMYETPITRAYDGISSMLDKIAIYLRDKPITEGRDGNGQFIMNAATKFDGIRKSFKGTHDDLVEEQTGRARGGSQLAYDEK